MPGKKYQKGFADPLSLLGLFFLVTTLVIGVSVTANPLKKQLVSSWARYNPDALIRQRERSGECKGKCCLIPTLPDCQKDIQGVIKPIKKDENITTVTPLPTPAPNLNYPGEERYSQQYSSSPIPSPSGTQQITSKPVNPTATAISRSPTPIPTPTLIPKVQVIPTNFVYYSQKDPRWADNGVVGKGTWRDSACGLMAGAMVTRTDPYTYYNNFQKYFQKQGQERLLTNMGTAFDDHKVVLENLGYDLIPVSGSSIEVKSQIRNYTKAGVAVWVNAYVWSGSKWVGHNTVAIGVDNSGDIVFNDPWYGQNVTIPDSRIDEGDNNPWKVFAVIPPGS